MTTVVDSSVVVAALTDSGSIGRWAERRSDAGPLAAPRLMPDEVADILRRTEKAGDVSASGASSASASTTYHASWGHSTTGL